MSRRDVDQEPRPPGLRGATRVLLERELDLAWGGGGGPLLACGFFACLTAILPLAAGGDPRTLGPVAGGVAWLALALASLLSLERLFERDMEDGALDLLALGHLALEQVNGLSVLVFQYRRHVYSSNIFHLQDIHELIQCFYSSVSILQSITIGPGASQR